MQDFILRVYSYTMENKKEILPHLFLYYVLFAFGKATTFLPSPFWAIVNGLVAFPVFIWSFFRTIKKMEDDALDYWDAIFLLLVLPILMIAVPFVLYLIFW